MRPLRMAAWLRQPCPDGSIVPPDQPCPVIPPRPRTLYFASGSAVLSDDDKASLADLVALLAAAPQLQVQVQGHAEEGRNATEKERLSEERAKAVTTYFESQGVRPGQMTIRAFGAGRLVVEGSSDPMNRRVELLFARQGEPFLDF